MINILKDYKVVINFLLKRKFATSLIILNSIVFTIALIESFSLNFDCTVKGLSFFINYFKAPIGIIISSAGLYNLYLLQKRTRLMEIQVNETKTYNKTFYYNNNYDKFKDFVKKSKHLSYLETIEKSTKENLVREIFNECFSESSSTPNIVIDERISTVFTKSISPFDVTDYSSMRIFDESLPTLYEIEKPEIDIKEKLDDIIEKVGFEFKNKLGRSLNMLVEKFCNERFGPFIDLLNNKSEHPEPLYYDNVYSLIEYYKAMGIILELKRFTGNGIQHPNTLNNIIFFTRRHYIEIMTEARKYTDEEAAYEPLFDFY